MCIVSNLFSSLRFVDTTASIGEDVINKVTVLPNPLENTFYISYDVQSDLSAAVYNLSGKLLMSVDLSENNQIDMSDCSKGIYFAKIKINGKYLVKKLILK